MKRFISVVMAVFILVTLFAGCKGTNSGKVELIWAAYSRQHEDSEIVLKAFNEKLGEVLPNTSIKLIECDETNWQLYMSSKKQIDIAWTGYLFDMQNEINSGAYQPLDDLIKEYAPNIQQEMVDYEDDYKSGTYNGKLYMIPCQQAIMNQTTALTIPVSLVKYMDIDAVRAAADKSPTSTRELYDLVDDYLEKVFASYDYDTDVVGTTIDIYSLYQTLAFRGYDFVGSKRTGPLLCYEAFADDPEVVSFYETDAFKLFCEYTAKWCEKGYISEEALLLGTSSGAREEILKGNNSAMWFGTDNPETGEERGVVYSVTDGEITSYNILLSNLNNLFNGVNKFGYENTYLTIPFTSKNPERAMQLLDLMRSEKGTVGNDLLNLLIYGFEKNSEEAEKYGTYHYVLEGDCAYANDYVSQPDSDSKYGICRWVVGNTMLCHRTPNILEGQTEYCIDYEKNVKKTLYNTKYSGASVDMTDSNIDMSNLAAVESMKPDSGELIHAASMGIMFRSGLENDASEVFLHCRPEGVVAVFRSVGYTGKGTSVRYSNIAPVYPVQLRMTKTGKTVVCEFKTANMSSYKTFSPANFTFTAPGPLYAGICGHSNNRNQYNIGVFKDIKFDGIGTYVPSADSGSADTSSGGTEETPELEKVDEDPVITDENILMYETFTDGVLNDEAMAKGEYSWFDSAIKEFDISEEMLMDENKNRYLYRTDITDGAIYVGSQKWTDYQATVDVSFTEDCDLDTANSNNRFLLYARNFINDYYGYTDYAAVCQNVLNDKKETVQQIALYKRTNYRDDLGIEVQAVTVENFYGDNLWHKLSISVVDNKVKVYWDGKCLIDFVDDGTIVTQDTTGGFINVTCNEGGVGISSIGAFVKVDNLLVEKIEDPIGGDFDNYIGDLWDEPIPQYILDSIDKGIQYELGGEK